MTTSPLVRSAIIVADIDRSERFYCDVIGLSEVYFKGELDGDAVGPLLGLPNGTRAKALILKSEGPSFGMVGLFELDPAPAPRTPSSGGLEIGETCLVFYVDELDALVQRLADRDMELACPPLTLPIRANYTSREMTFRDPDGVMINCIERDAGWEEKNFG